MAKPDSPVLPRSISSADLTCTNRCRSYILRDWVQQAPPGLTNYFNITPSFTLTLPPLSQYPKEFQDFVFRRIIDFTIKEDLQASKSLNWCSRTSHLVPLITIGDGNCLLHAASLGMWGFQDRDFTLRKAVYEAIRNCQDNSLYKRWLDWRSSEMLSIGVKLERDQWQREWDQVVDNVSLQKGNHGMLEGLDQFHVFVLANVLRRPIIMYSMSKVHSVTEGTTLQRVEFHGVYLPLLWDPLVCKKNPIPLAFSNGHFSTLVVIDLPGQYHDGHLLLPLADCFGQDLPIRFQAQSEKHYDIRRTYLNIREIPPSGATYMGRNIPCAMMTITKTPGYLEPLLSGFIDKCLDAYQYLQKQSPISQPPMQVGHSQGSTSSKEEKRSPCLMGCGFSGDAIFGGYCSQCYKKKPQIQSSEQLRQNYQNQHPDAQSSSCPSLRCCNDCNNPGRPELLGMCEQCYHSKKVPVSDESSPLLESRPCRTPGCEHFGTIETNFHCSQCFKKKMPELYGQSQSPSQKRRHHTVQQELVVGMRDERVDLPNRHSQDRNGIRTEPKPPMCANCQTYFGSPEFGGLCTECFMDKTKQEATSKGDLQGNNPHHQEPLGNSHGISDPTYDHVQNPIGQYREPIQEPYQNPLQTPSGIPNDHRQQQVIGGQPLDKRDFGTGDIGARGFGTGDIRSNYPPGGTSPLQPGMNRLNIYDEPIVNPSERARPDPQCFMCHSHVHITVFNYVCEKHAISIRNMISGLKSEEKGEFGKVTPVQLPPQPIIPSHSQHPRLQDRGGEGGWGERGGGEGGRGGEGGGWVNDLKGGRNMVDLGVAGATGGGIEGKVIGQVGKLLCRTVGCGFYGIRENDGLCKDCYEKYYLRGVPLPHAIPHGNY